MKSVALSIDALQEAVAQMPDDRLAATRRAALAHLSKHGLPTMRDEEWKYTDLTRIVDIGNRWLSTKSDLATSAGLDEAIKDICGSIDADWLIILSGQIDRNSISSFSQPGVAVTRLTESDGDGVTPSAMTS